MTPLVDGTEVPLAQRHDTALLDLDGVLYVGPDAVPGAADAVALATAAGMRLAFVTNNAARTPQTVAAHLRDLGIPAEPDDVVTSAQAAVTLVVELVPAGSRVLVVGGDGLHAALLERDLHPVGTAAENPAAVVQGFSPDVGWSLLAEGTYAVRAGMPWVASNLDTTVPTPQGLAPGNGALVEVIAGATGRRPVVAGKPETPLHQEAVRRTGSAHPLVVGDRIDTDIEGAHRAGVDSLLVLTGVATPTDLVMAEEAQRPTYVAGDLRTGLLGTHPPVRRLESGAWACGGWVCDATAGGIELTGSGEGMDGLRALCVAHWAKEGADSHDDISRLVARLGL